MFNKIRQTNILHTLALELLAHRMLEEHLSAHQSSGESQNCDLLVVCTKAASQKSQSRYG
jgi:hypothetical protein